jgi:putative nucleotidyltransferase with HDIG domain
MNNNLMRDRSYCFDLLCEYTKSDSLRKHALAVEACVRAYAAKFGEDVVFWGNVALLHDFDYELYPSSDEHPFKGSEILNGKGFSEEFRSAIMSHAGYSGIPRDTPLRKILFACDELAGFITAVAYVRPSRSIDDVEARSVLKKMKDKAFARAVSREDILSGAELIGEPLEKHIGFCIDAMKKEKGPLGL